MNNQRQTRQRQIRQPLLPREPDDDQYSEEAPSPQPPVRRQKEQPPNGPRFQLDHSIGAMKSN